jgi:hypothetical protein
MGSDFHAITVFATPTESTGDYRFATKYAGPVAPQSVMLGAPLAATAVSSLASGAYPRFRFQGALPQDYDKGVEIDIQADDEVANLFVILASAGYLTARGNPLAYDLSMPDIAGLGGFLAGSRLTAGSNTVAVTAFGFTGTGVFDLRPTLGAESKGAVKTSSLAVP